MVTHDPRAASFADRVLVLADGEITRDMSHPTYADILEVFADDDEAETTTSTEGAQSRSVSVCVMREAISAVSSCQSWPSRSA